MKTVRLIKPVSRMWPIGHRPLLVPGDELPMHRLMTRLLKSLDARVEPATIAKRPSTGPV
jgi:hypothetical protein